MSTQQEEPEVEQSELEAELLSPPEGLEHMAMTPEELELLGDESEPEPEPEEPSRQAPSEAPEPERDVEPRDAAPPEESEEEGIEGFRARLKGLSADQRSDELVRLFQQHTGQRRALAKSTLRRQEAENSASSNRAMLEERERELVRQRSEISRLHAIAVSQGVDLGESIDYGAPQPEEPQTFEAERSEPTPQSELDNYRNSAEQLLSRDTDNTLRPTIEYLEGARRHLASEITAVIQSEGYRPQTIADTFAIIESAGIQAKLEQVYPGVRAEDLVDIFSGGRLMERVVRQYARDYFPNGGE